MILLNGFIVLVFLCFALLAFSFFERYRIECGLNSISDVVANYVGALKVEDKVSHSICFGVVLIFMVPMVFARPEGDIGAVLLLLIALGFGVGAVFVVFKDGLFGPFIRKSKYFFGLMSALIGLIVNNVAKAVTDASISGFVGIEASNFPVAQGFVSVIITLIVWLFFLCFLALAAYAVAILFLLIGKNMDGMGKSAVYCGPGLNSYRFKLKVLRVVRLFSIVLAAAFYSIITPDAVVKISGSAWFGRVVTKVIVFSSYHLKPAACGIEDLAEGTWVSQIRYKWASVAVPDDVEGYKFYIRDCPMHTGS